MQTLRNFTRRIDPFIIVLICLGILVLGFKVKITYPIKWIGHAEEANYAEMAESLIQGKGFNVDYIGYGYWFSPLRYPEITHPDAHYTPLYSILIVPFFLILGKTAFAAKLPSLIISSLFGPIVVYLIARRLSKSRLVGTAAAVSTLLFPAIFGHSLRPDDDSIFPFLMFATCYFAMKTIDHFKYYWITGIFIGLTYYSKGSALIFVPAILVSFVAWRGWQVLRDRRMWTCFVAAFLVMLPWFIRNTVHFHDPLFSTENYAAGYIGYESWKHGTYSLYWDQKRPTLIDKLTRDPKVTIEKTKYHFKSYLWWGFIDIGGKWTNFDGKRLFTYITGIPSILGIYLYLCSIGYSFARRVFGRAITVIPPRWAGVLRKANDLARRFIAPWQMSEALVLLLVNFIVIVFLAVCWEPITRLAFPLAITTITLGWVTYHKLLRQILGRLRHSGIIISVMILILMSLVGYRSGAQIWEDSKTRGWPYRDTNQEWIDAGKWLKENAKGSITMTRNPWELHFYSGEKAVQIPYSNLENTIKVMKYYRVTHFIPDGGRPALKPMVKGEIPGLKLVYDGKLKIYEVRYDEMVGFE